MEVKEKIRMIIAEHLDKEVSEVDDGHHLMNDLGADSLDLVKIVVAFEEQLEMEIRDSVAEGFVTMTVGDIADQLLKELMG